MIDTKAKRAAAIGYGLSFLLVLPPADGIISIEDAGHALNVYQFDLPELQPPPVVTVASRVLVEPVALASAVSVGALTYADDVRVKPIGDVTSLQVD